MKEPAGSHSRILRGQAHTYMVDSSQKSSLEFLKDLSELVQLFFCGDCLCSTGVFVIWLKQSKPGKVPLFFFPPIHLGPRAPAVGDELLGITPTSEEG